MKKVSIIMVNYNGIRYVGEKRLSGKPSEYMISLFFNVGISLFKIVRAFLMKNKNLVLSQVKGILDALVIYSMLSRRRLVQCTR